MFNDSKIHVCQNYWEKGLKNVWLDQTTPHLTNSNAHVRTRLAKYQSEKEIDYRLYILDHV